MSGSPGPLRAVAASDDFSPLPPLRVDHVLRLTDDTSIIQHSVGSVPDPRSGYTLDDAARALIVAAKLENCDLPFTRRVGLIARYLAFLAYAQKADGSFHNDFSYARRPLDEVGSQDCQGQAAWGLAVAAVAAPPAGQRFAAQQLLRRALPTVWTLTAPRALAFALLGLCELLAAEDEGFQTLHAEAANCALALAERLAAYYDTVAADDWRWFEDYLTYANARLPEAMLRAGAAFTKPRWQEIGVASLEFLSGLTLRGDRLQVIGNQGWMRRGQTEPAVYDQQCVDAGAMAEAAVAAFELTGSADYRVCARRCLDWFHGGNVQDLQMYEETTGACFDGLTPNGVNRNQGAESTLTYLMARLALRAPVERGCHA